MKKCNCYIGHLLDNPLTKENIKEEFDFEIRTTKNFFNKTVSYKELTDSRKNYLHRFNFCPYCGEKLNWKEIIKSLCPTPEIHISSKNFNEKTQIIKTN